MSKLKKAPLIIVGGATGALMTCSAFRPSMLLYTVVLKSFYNCWFF